MATYIAPGVWRASGTQSGGEVISDAQLGGQVLNPSDADAVPAGGRLAGASPELEVSDDGSVLIGLPGLTQISPRAVPADTLTTNRLPDDTRSDIELRVIS